MQSNSSIDEFVSLARVADDTLTTNARKIVLDILYLGAKSNTSNVDKILSLGVFFDNAALKHVGDTKNKKITSDIQKSKELLSKISQCTLKINQMSYNSLLVVLEQYSIGGVNSAINYITNGTRILRTKRYNG